MTTYKISSRGRSDVVAKPMTDWVKDAEAACEAATEGPWTCEDHHGWAHPYISVTAKALGKAAISDLDRDVLRPVFNAHCTVGKVEREIDNCKFIALARTALPRALKAIKAADELVKTCEMQPVDGKVAKRQRKALAVYREARNAG